MDMTLFKDIIEEKLIKIIRENDPVTAAIIMHSIMRDCVCAEVVGTPDEISEKVNMLVDFAIA